MNSLKYIKCEYGYLFILFILSGISCRSQQLRSISGTYKSKSRSDIVIGARRLLSIGTVTGNALTLSKYDSYSLKTCGGLSSGHYSVQENKVILFQQAYTTCNIAATSLSSYDTIIYTIQPDGSLMNRSSGYFLNRGRKKQVLSIDHLVKTN